MKAVIVLLAGTRPSYSALALVHCYIVTVSNTDTMLTDSSFTPPGTNAVLITTTSQWQWAVPPSNYSTAKWIWNADPAIANEVNTQIYLKHTFQIQCPGQTLALRMNADNAANYSLLGKSGTTADWWTQKTDTFVATGTSCGTFNTNSGVPISLQITAINQGGPGGLIFELTSSDCPDVTCSGSMCGCSPCSDFMPGCATCDAIDNCLTCKSNDYRRSVTPVSGANPCPCLDLFYQDATGNCVICPLDMNCATCEQVSNQVRCTSCFCDQHRQLDPTTHTCICESNRVPQLEGDAYCVPDTE